MGLQEQISRIKQVMNLYENEESYTLPEKPNHHLFNDEWLSKFETNGEKIKLYHFGPPNLEHLDPTRFGEHSYTRSSMGWGKPRIYFYTREEQRQMDSGPGGTLYTTEVNLKDLYPFNKDPLDLYDIAAIKYGNKTIPVAMQLIYISDMLQEIGYKGMIYKWEGGIGELIATIWDRVDNIVKTQAKKLPKELTPWAYKD